MPNRYPFRHMRLTVKLIRAQVQLLLAVEGLEWSERDYTMFFVMSEMTDKTFHANPVYTQVIGALGAWLQFYKRLIDQLVVGELRANMEAEWGKVAEPYKELLEEKVK